MDIGDLILYIVNLLLLLCSVFTIYILIKMKKFYKKYRFKRKILLLVIVESIMLFIGWLQIWVLFYQPFAHYTWYKIVPNDFLEVVVNIIRGGYLLSVIVIIPALILVSIIMKLVNIIKNLIKS